MLKAPFNFVPLNETPYIPTWANQVSQDIPFEDGLSGSLRLKITAESPIFVSKSKSESNTASEFCNIVDSKGQKLFFIPGTSIKGMLRNVMEILSFGKMTQVQNQSFGIRDLSNGKDGRFYRNKVKVDNVHCGWLKQGKNGYLLTDCGLPWRISTEIIDAYYKSSLTDFIMNDDFKTDDNKTAHIKYEMFRGRKLIGKFVPYKMGINAGGRKFVRFGNNGEEGTVVFTGQPGKRKQIFDRRKGKKVWTGKFFEFVFPSAIERDDVAVPENVFRAFESIHQNSSDYRDYLRSDLRRGREIPVFFMYDNEGEIDSMGISYMYKYPAYNDVYNGIPSELLNNNVRDLCECIFGFTGKRESLKGRVQFSSAFLKSSAMFSEDTLLALSKPHPSYYPLYLGKGQTWNTENIRIAGRKRYPVREGNNLLQNIGTENMQFCIRPLKEGAIFENTITFHNLRPIELGALLSAIDFCQNADCFHNLGLGKPLGYGKIRIDIIDFSIQSISETSFTLDQARESFIKEMENSFRGWGNSVQLNELFAMARGIPKTKDSQFVYMKMSTNSNENEFKDGLSRYASGEQLGTFTQIIEDKVPNIPQSENVSVNAKRISHEFNLPCDNEKEVDEISKTQEKQQQELESFNVAKDLFDREEYNDAKQEFVKLLENACFYRSDIANCLELIDEKQKESELIASKAKETFDKKLYTDAKSLYSKAASFKFQSYDVDIQLCDLEIEKTKNLSSDIATYLASVKLASIAAFAGNLRRRNESVPITSDDVSFIIQKIKNDWPSLKKDARKQWLDIKKWRPLQDAIGHELSNAIYECVRELPVR